MELDLALNQSRDKNDEISHCYLIVWLRLCLGSFKVELKYFYIFLVWIAFFDISKFEKKKPEIPINLHSIVFFFPSLKEGTFIVAFFRR